MLWYFIVRRSEVRKSNLCLTWEMNSIDLVEVSFKLCVGNILTNEGFTKLALENRTIVFTFNHCVRHDSFELVLKLFNTYSILKLFEDNSSVLCFWLFIVSLCSDAESLSYLSIEIGENPLSLNFLTIYDRFSIDLSVFFYFSISREHSKRLFSCNFL